jgi:NAD(P)-dependent dehydrogenase (short-subunit alcohol dehydrogenase family)
LQQNNPQQKGNTLSYNDRFSLKDQIILLTGGAGLIGKEYVKALVGTGATVIIGDIDIGLAKKMAEKAGNQNVRAVHLDVSSQDSVQLTVQYIMDNYSRIDGLINNAALDPKFDPEHANKHTYCFENYPLKLWQEELNVNITGMFLCSQAVGNVMKAQGKGNIVNVSSIYGLVGPDQRLYEKDDPRAAVVKKPVTYSVSKSAVIGLTKYLATYWSKTGIRVNTLTLGGVYNDHEDEFVRRYNSRVPLGRMANADEYSGALIYLLSDASSYMTGANLVVDGGWTAW